MLDMFLCAVVRITHWICMPLGPISECYNLGIMLVEFIP